MNVGAQFSTAVLIAVAGAAFAADSAQPSINGDYLEVRSCDVYVGACFANGEMGLEGNEDWLR